MTTFQVTIYMDAENITEVFTKYPTAGVKPLAPGDRTGVVYPEFCRRPTACRGRGSCPLNPSCVD